MLVVSDTSPVSGLYRIGQLELLHLLYDQVVIPDAVFNELMQLRTFYYDLKEITNSSWIVIKSANDAVEVERFQKELDLGEAESIVLAKELKADLLLMDEMKGRTIAEKEGIQIIGLVGILVQAKNEGHIAAVKPLLDELIYKANFRVSPKLYDLILKNTGEII